YNDADVFPGPPVPYFFSSRRRHTRFSRDWSSDVCSSDVVVPRNCIDEDKKLREIDVRIAALTAAQLKKAPSSYPLAQKTEDERRSEERRVGKVRRWRWSGGSKISKEVRPGRSWSDREIKQ